ATIRPDKRERELGSQSDSVLRRYVSGLAKPSATIWVSTTRGLFYQNGKSNEAWQTAIPGFPGATPAGVAANNDYAIVPSFEPNGCSSGDSNFGGLFVYEIQKKTHWRLTQHDGLNQVYAAMLDGSKAWLGAENFVALLDLPSRRLERTFRFPSAFRVRSMALDS